MNLNVIVQPKQVTIFDEKWAERNTFVGPYLEGENMNVICQAVGGGSSRLVTFTSNVSTINISHIFLSPFLFDDMHFRLFDPQSSLSNSQNSGKLIELFYRSFMLDACYFICIYGLIFQSF